MIPGDYRSYCIYALLTEIDCFSLKTLPAALVYL